MPNKPTIIISPSDGLTDESGMINQLFDAGLYRYHIHKNDATEQSIAEILERVELQYLNRITLHSHFHLVLAYGVGGIHYSLDHRKTLGPDYRSKVQLYQGFGVKVSTDVGKGDWSLADYVISIDRADDLEETVPIFFLSEELQSIGTKPRAISLTEVLKKWSLEDIIIALAN